MHARIVDNAVAEWPIPNLRQRLPDVSLPLDLTNDAVLPSGFVWVLQLSAPAFNPETERLVSFGPERRSGRWVSGYKAQPLSSDELTQIRATRAEDVRAERNRRLAACDWTQLADAPVNRSSWSAYRQALRDVPEQQGFPFAVQWPQEP